MPAKPVGESTAPGVVTLQLETLHSGIGESDSLFVFVVRIQLLSSGRAKDNTEVEFRVDDYQSGTVVPGVCECVCQLFNLHDYSSHTVPVASNPLPSPTTTVTPTDKTLCVKSSVLSYCSFFFPASSGASCTSSCKHCVTICDLFPLWSFQAW